MVNSDKKYKGVLLECMLAYDNILVSNIPNYIKHIFSLGVSESSHFKSYLFGDDCGDPILSFNNLGYKNLLINDYKFEGLRYLTFNLNYTMYDVKVDLAFSIDFEYSVITLSTSEGFIRAFDLKKPIDKNRIRAYLNLCNDFCRKFPPKYSSVTDESFIPSEFNVKELVNKPKYKYEIETSFDEKEVEGLYSYYS